MQEREWEEDSERVKWEKAVYDLESVDQTVELIQKLDDGMSLPTTLLKRSG